MNKYDWLGEAWNLIILLMFCCPLQVREEYINIVCTPQMKKRSDFSSTNPSSSQSQVSIGFLSLLQAHMWKVTEFNILDIE